MLLTVKRDNIIYVLLLISMWNPTQILSQECMCCSQATGYCKTVCEKISLVDVALDATAKSQTLQELHTYCSLQLNPFWDCLNATFKEISRGESWPGRTCCTLPLSETCKRSCVTATSEYDLYQGCRQSDEIAFFNCVDKQSQGETCCSHARTSGCKSACTEIFKHQQTPTKVQRDEVISHCEYSSPKVLNCIKNFTTVTPATNLHKQIHCCDKSNKSKCREACKNALLTTATHQEAIDMIELGGCGLPLLQDQFWQCFFKPDDSVTTIEVSRIEKVGMDSAKWHCCQKATSAHCKRLCSKTFRKDWSTSWEQFHLKCLSQPSEEAMRNCIDEVEEPCELGCDGLSFCTNFNNRPTELFRSCTPQADEAARNDVSIWKNQNDLSLPGLNLPLKNISECSLNTWKTVACTLHIKPCSRDTHGNQICRDVCLDIISLCVDWSSVSLEHTPETICDGLSPKNTDASCVSLQNYLHPAQNPYQPSNGQVSSPCKGDPCGSDEICIVNRNCVVGNSCVPYKCVRGCKLGEVSEYAVPEGAYVRIPMPNNLKGCLQICKCTNGRIEDCQPLPCVPLNPCVIGNNQYKEHGSVYSKECNTCICFAEENICTKKLCKSNTETGKDSVFTTMPCNYPPHYIPVCGRNGNTYPSSSLAKCAGLNDSDIEYGACSDPCKNNPCSVGHKCVPNTQVCLSLNQKLCLQYQCVNGTINCHELPKEPVCDVENKEYQNSCFLAHHNSKFAYKGPCLSNCKHVGKVCGINGKSYISECAAWADFVSVDYQGACITVGLITNTNAKQCADVQCTSLPDQKCAGVTPPGACCPVCGGAIRLLYSSRQIDRALYALQNKSTESVSLTGLLKSLERHIQVAQCGVKGFLSVEGDIFVVVQSTEKYPSQLQLEACVREAEKLASLVNKQSPRIVSELSLSCLTAAMTVHSFSSVNSFKEYNAGISTQVFTHASYFVNVLIIYFLLS